MQRDFGLDTLLELHGQSFHEDNGYWWKISVRQVTPTPEKPHGLDYELTLHNPANIRIMGFDNAHPVKHTAKGKPSGKYRGRIITWDHQHKSPNDKGVAYEFSTAQQLLNDFFNAANAHINNGKKVKP